MHTIDVMAGSEWAARLEERRQFLLSLRRSHASARLIPFPIRPASAAEQAGHPVAIEMTRLSAPATGEYSTSALAESWRCRRLYSDEALNQNPLPPQEDHAAKLQRTESHYRLPVQRLLLLTLSVWNLIEAWLLFSRRPALAALNVVMALCVGLALVLTWVKKRF